MENQERPKLDLKVTKEQAEFIYKAVYSSPINTSIEGILRGISVAQPVIEIIDQLETLLGLKPPVPKNETAPGLPPAPTEAV